MRNFRDLEVWNRSHRLTLDLYRVTGTFPNDERFGLTSQIRRAAASIPTNLSEGCGRRGDGEMARFVQIAMGSASELDYLLLLSTDLNYLHEQEYEKLVSELNRVRRMLTGLYKTLKGSLTSTTSKKPNKNQEPRAKGQEPKANGYHP